MKTNFVVIAYRPDGNDFYGGYTHGRSRSHQEIGYFENYWSAAEFIAKYECFKKTDPDALASPRNFCEYEITVLLNGVVEDNLDWDDPDYEESKNEFTRLFLEIATCRDRLGIKK